MLHDVCTMLRVGHSQELIGVLGHVVRVATTVPHLERLRESALLRLEGAAREGVTLEGETLLELEAPDAANDSATPDVTEAEPESVQVPAPPLEPPLAPPLAPPLMPP